MFREIERTPFEELGMSFDFDNGIVIVTGRISFSDGKKLFHTHFEIPISLDIKSKEEFVECLRKRMDAISEERLKILNMLLGG